MEKKKYVSPAITKEQLQEELIRINDELQKAYDQVLSEKKQTMEFFSNMSHDLRSPIAALSNSIEYLKTPNISPEEQQQVLGIMEKRTAYLKKLINDMFYLAKMDFHSQEAQLQPIELRYFIEEFFYSCEVDDYYSKHELKLYIPDDFDYIVNMDPDMMHRVLDNLFTNARKYSDKGTKIILSTYAKDGYAYISVEDEGFGISKEDLPFIFDRSFRTDKARTHIDNSSGLGLAIVKDTVELHGGYVTCTSELNQGSVFIVALPIVN